MKPCLAVIGGSGLYDIDGLVDVEEHVVDTPYGSPSDAVRKATVAGTDQQLLFIPRHGRGHRIPPHAINYRANICALKKLGATHVLSVSATGSMKENIAPGDLVVVDQFIDLTKRRISTFFDEGVAAHVAFADPVCPSLADALHKAASVALQGKTPNLHKGGTYVCIEGPQFSTRAESLVYRGWGVDLVGMTNMPEAKLAREAELAYATLGLATDYDCWHESEEAVDVAAVVARVKTMVGHAKAIIVQLATTLGEVTESPAHTALQGAIMTSSLTDDKKQELGWLLED